MIGNQLKTLRQSRNLKQEWLASQTGVSQAYISEIETGKRQPTLEHLEKFAKYYQRQSVKETIIELFK